MVDRRRFLAGTAASLAALALAACGRGDTAPEPEPSDAARVDPPPAPPELDANQPRHVGEARAFLVAVPTSLRMRSRALLPPETHSGLDHGLLALSDVCPSDKIALSHCASSRWFNCPACGSLFDPLGDRMAGPAPAGTSLHAVTVDRDEDVDIVRVPLLAGLADGVRLVAHDPPGPHCL